MDHDSCSRCSHLLPEHAHLCFEELIFISPARNSEFSQLSLFSYFFDFSHVRQVFFHCIIVQVEAASTGFKAFLHSKVFKDPNLQLFPKSFPSRAARRSREGMVIGSDRPMLCQCYANLPLRGEIWAPSVPRTACCAGAFAWQKPPLSILSLLALLVGVVV